MCVCSLKHRTNFKVVPRDLRVRQISFCMGYAHYAICLSGIKADAIIGEMAHQIRCMVYANCIIELYRHKYRRNHMDRGSICVLAEAPLTNRNPELPLP